MQIFFKLKKHTSISFLVNDAVRLLGSRVYPLQKPELLYLANTCLLGFVHPMWHGEGGRQHMGRCQTCAAQSSLQGTGKQGSAKELNPTDRGWRNSPQQARILQNSMLLLAVNGSPWTWHISSVVSINCLSIYLQYHVYRYLSAISMYN